MNSSQRLQQNLMMDGKDSPLEEDTRGQAEGRRRMKREAEHQSQSRALRLERKREYMRAMRQNQNISEEEAERQRRSRREYRRAKRQNLSAEEAERERRSRREKRLNLSTEEAERQRRSRNEYRRAKRQNLSAEEAERARRIRRSKRQNVSAVEAERKRRIRREKRQNASAVEAERERRNESHILRVARKRESQRARRLLSAQKLMQDLKRNGAREQLQPALERTDGLPPAPKVQCPVCSKFFFPRNVQGHILLHLPRVALPFQCKVCGRGFSTFDVYRSHYQKHIVQDPPMTPGIFFCDFCSTTIETRVKFLAHLRDHLETGDAQFGENEELLFYQCDSPGCWVLFRDKVQFDHHVVAHPGSLICNVCGKCFAEPGNYENHRKRAHTSDASEESPCSYCWEILKKDQMETHRRKHVLILSDAPTPEAICHVCGKSSYNEVLLARHMSTVHGSFTCQICGLKPSSLKQLESHYLNVHTYEHPLVCHICSKEFRFLYLLNSHLRAHAGVKRVLPLHKCLYCTRSFSFHIQRNHHQVLAHPTPHLAFNPFYCPACYRAFQHEEELKRHLESHEKTQCRVCKTYTISNAALKFHMYSHQTEGRKKKQYNNISRNALRRAKIEENLKEVGTLYNTNTTPGEGNNAKADSVEELSTTRPRDDFCMRRFTKVALMEKFQKESNQEASTSSINRQERDGELDASLIRTEDAEERSLLLLLPVTPALALICDQCPLEFDSFKGLWHHLKWHDFEKTGRRNHADMAFPNMELIKALEVKHRNPRASPVSCRKCRKELGSALAWEKHLDGKYCKEIKKQRGTTKSVIRVLTPRPQASSVPKSSPPKKAANVPQGSQIQPVRIRKSKRTQPRSARFGDVCQTLTLGESSSAPLEPTSSGSSSPPTYLAPKTEVGGQPKSYSRIGRRKRVHAFQNVYDEVEEDPLEDPLANTLADAADAAGSSSPSQPCPTFQAVPILFISGSEESLMAVDEHLEVQLKEEDGLFHNDFEEEDPFHASLEVGEEEFDPEARYLVDFYKPSEHLNWEDAYRRATASLDLFPPPLRQHVQSLPFLTVSLRRMPLQLWPGRRYLVRDKMGGREEGKEPNENDEEQSNAGFGDPAMSKGTEPCHTFEDAEIKVEAPEEEVYHENPPGEDAVSFPEAENVPGVVPEPYQLRRLSLRVARRTKKIAYAEDEDGTMNDLDESPDWTVENEERSPKKGTRRKQTSSNPTGSQRRRNQSNVVKKFKNRSNSQQKNGNGEDLRSDEPAHSDIKAEPSELNEEEENENDSANFDSTDTEPERKVRKRANSRKKRRRKTDQSKPVSEEAKGRQGDFPCSLCGKVFDKKSSLSIHLRLHSNPSGKYPCTSCSEIFEKWQELKDHRLSVHVPKCPICKKSFPHWMDMEAHLKKHENEKGGAFACSLCPNRYDFYNSLKNHCKYKHEAKPPPRSNFAAAIQIQKPADFYCHVCSKKIDSKGRFDRHLRVHLRNPSESSDLIKEGLVLFTFLCDVPGCGMQFVRKETFLRHLESHSPTLSTSHPCSLCPKVFGDEMNLGAHVDAVHTKNQEDCGYCLSSFEDGNTLRIHVDNVHKIDLSVPLTGKYTCEICGRTFRDIKTLKSHITREHEEEESLVVNPSTAKSKVPKWRKEFGGKVYNNKKAPCPICQKVLTIRTALTNHLLMDHTYPDGVTCFICSKKFNRYGLLTNHLQEHEKRGDVNPSIILPSISKTSIFYNRNNAGEEVEKKKRNFHCKYCNQRCSDQIRQYKHYFQSHPEQHLAGTPFYCKLCYRAYATEKEYEDHDVKYHQKLRCKECGKQFFKIDPFRAHKLSHKNERPLERDPGDEASNIIHNLPHIHNVENPRAKDPRGRNKSGNGSDDDTSSSCSGDDEPEPNLIVNSSGQEFHQASEYFYYQ